MKLKAPSVKNLIGDSQDVMVYGLASCRYYDVCDALTALKLNVHLWRSSNFPFAMIDYDKLSYDETWSKDPITAGRKYKSIITSLIIENCKRVKEGKPIIPLIFCIGLQEDNKTISLKIENTAKSHRVRAGSENNSDFITTSITEKELRRCYKIYAEGSPEVQAIAKATFNFVKVKQDPDHSECYTLEKVKPIWEEACWDKAWQERTHLPVEFTKAHNWRSILKSSVSQSNSLFNPANSETNTKNSTKQEPHRIKSRL